MGRVLLLCLLVAWLVFRWEVRRRRLDDRAVAQGRRLPRELREPDAPRSWVLVTGPSPAADADEGAGALPDVGSEPGAGAEAGLRISAGESVEARLRELDPRAHVLHVQADSHPELLRRLNIGKRPTLILADRRGRVRHRLDGPRAVLNHLDPR